MAVCVLYFAPSLRTEPLPLLGLTWLELLAFLAFWALNVAVALKGAELIKKIEVVSAPVLCAVALALFIWSWVAVGDVWTVLEATNTLAKQDKGGRPFAASFASAVTAVIGIWATLALNIADFSRFARNQRAQVPASFAC